MRIQDLRKLLKILMINLIKREKKCMNFIHFKKKKKRNLLLFQILSKLLRNKKDKLPGFKLTIINMLNRKSHNILIKKPVNQKEKCNNNLRML